MTLFEDLGWEDEFAQYRQSILDYLLSREWDKRWAKKRGGRQTLFEHAVVEFDAMRVLIRILEGVYNLSGADKATLIFAVVAHDAGKESRPFQAYLDGGNFVSCIDEKLSQEVISDLSTKCSLEVKVTEALAAVGNHMAKIRRDPATAFKMVLARREDELSDDWKRIATLVWFTDDLCSCASLDECHSVLNLPEYAALAQVIRLCGHRANKIRGVTTSILHTACQKIHVDAGKYPMTFFPDGTLYVELANQKESMGIDRGSLTAEATRIISELVRRQKENLPSLVVGAPNTSVIAAPRFFQLSEIKRYLDYLIVQEDRKQSKATDDHVRQLLIGRLFANHSCTDAAGKKIDAHTYFMASTQKREKLLSECVKHDDDFAREVRSIDVFLSDKDREEERKRLRSDLADGKFRTPDIPHWKLVRFLIT